MKAVYIYIFTLVAKINEPSKISLISKNFLPFTRELRLLISKYKFLRIYIAKKFIFNPCFDNSKYLLTFNEYISS